MIRIIRKAIRIIGYAMLAVIVITPVIMLYMTFTPRVDNRRLTPEESREVLLNGLGWSLELSKLGIVTNQALLPGRDSQYLARITLPIDAWRDLLNSDSIGERGEYQSTSGPRWSHTTSQTMHYIDDNDNFIWVVAMNDSSVDICVQSSGTKRVKSHVHWFWN